jgi:membrane protease YdiL (CAAX protease family)
MSESVRAAAAAWLAYLAAVLAGMGQTDAGSMVLAAVTGAALVVVGYAAVGKLRPQSARTPSQRARIALLALGAGIVLGLANLAANVAIAAMDPEIRQLLGRRFVNLSPIDTLIQAPIMEEIMLRLFFMSVLAWLVSGITSSRRTIFLASLTVSAVVFAVLHLNRPMPADQTVAAAYSVALVVKYSLAGLTLGWVFWRWGLPYAMLCHCAVNATHLLLQDAVFG